MKIVKLCQMEDSFASFNSPKSNFSKFAYLKVGGDKEQGYNNDLNKSLLKFDLSNINAFNDINKIELDLYVRDITSEKDSVTIGVYINKDDFWQNDVNWSNSPNINKQLGAFTINKKNKNSYISIDITSIALQWLNNTLDNNGITLLAEGRGDNIIFVSSRGYNAPILKIQYNGEKLHSYYGDNCKNNKIDKAFMLINAKDSTILEKGQTITFSGDKKSNGIKYLQNGEIIINDSGKYLVNFWMNCKNESDENKKLEVDLVKYTSENRLTTVLKASSYEPIIKGKSAIVAATGTLNVSGNEIYKFVNVSNNNMKLSSINNEMGASVVITKIE